MLKLIKENNGFLFHTILILLVVACNRENKKSRDPLSSDNIYLDYKVTATEGDDNLTILLQLRDGGDEEDGVNGALKMMLDGESILPDSTALGGIFYETHQPIESFAGPHEIVFQAADGKEYREKFTFQPVVLNTVIADTVYRSDLVFEFSGLEPGDRVRVLLTDTSFINDGVNRVEKLRDGKLVIDSSSLDRVANGPVLAEFIREFEQPIKDGTKAGGRLRITYALKREFFLADRPGTVRQGGLQRIYTLK